MHHLLQDNAPGHRNKTKLPKLLKKRNYELINLPAQSPDLNILENLWSVVKAQMAGRMYADRQEHFSEIQKAFVKAYDDHYEALVNSMPARLAAVIAARGGNTHY